MVAGMCCLSAHLYPRYLQGQRRGGAVDLELLLEAGGGRRGRRVVGRGGQGHHARRAVLWAARVQ